MTINMERAERAMLESEEELIDAKALLRRFQYFQAAGIGAILLGIVVIVTGISVEFLLGGLNGGAAAPGILVGIVSLLGSWPLLYAAWGSTDWSGGRKTSKIRAARKDVARAQRGFDQAGKAYTEAILASWGG